MKKVIGVVAVLVGVAAAIALYVVWLASPEPGPPFDHVARRPRLEPDYIDLVIPPNIAPLNFRILEPGRRFHVKLLGKHGMPVTATSSSGNIEFPLRGWRELLTANKGGEIRVEVYSRAEDGRWTSFVPFENIVAAEPIDPYLTYRFMEPWYESFDRMAIYRRDLASFDEALVLDERLAPGSCINCHSSADGKSGESIVHVRFPFVMLAGRDGRVDAIDTRTDFNKAPFAYTAWHPDGHTAVFSFNKILQLFHTRGETRDVFDFNSDLLVYDFETNTVSSNPVIARKDAFETFPAWSPDGRSLYFCSTPAVSEKDLTKFKDVRYSLMRVSFDPRTRAWGDVETLVDANALGRSVSAPRVSPDGRFVAVVLSSYGSFPIFQQDADLYLYDVEARRLDPMACNSGQTDSWHAWSANGRWLAFSTKRDDTLFTRVYFTYVDKNGKAHKPFVLPQKSPSFYEGLLKVYNVPEFATTPASASPRALGEALRRASAPRKAQLDPETRRLVLPETK